MRLNVTKHFFIKDGMNHSRKKIVLRINETINQDIKLNHNLGLFSEK